MCGERVIASRRGPFGRDTDAWILPAIDEVLAEGDLAIGALGGIGVTVGPGTFTGIRVGMATAMGTTLAWVGLLLFATTTVFTLITLPVEFDASRRALACLSGRYVTDDELRGARKVLNAAALTYVAAFITSILTLLYWAYRLGLIGGRRQ